jgi:hypothetical protein
MECNIDAGLDRDLQIAGKDVLQVLIGGQRLDRPRFSGLDAAQPARQFAQPRVDHG